jgi:hypothetical protein
MSEENNEAVAEGAAQAEAANAVGLNIGDLAGLRQIINVAAQRGAFRAEEMEVIGRVYNKLNAFLNSLAPAEEAAEEEAAEETTEETETSEG